VRLATEGAAVVGSQRNAEEGDALVESLGAEGLELAFVAGDVRDEGHCERLVTATVERYGRVDVLCNNAGVGLLKSVVETEREEYDRVLDTNLWGLFACSRYAIPHMVAGGGGSVVNIGSVAASVGFATDAAYCASKGAVHALTRQMALDYAQHRIRVNCVAPGFTMSDGVKEHPEVIEQLRDVSVAARTIQRDQNPEDVVGAVTYLVGPTSSFVTGQTIVIDGGQYFH
jgi:NAD(P)-dependent dehydrogenase (short-subunit alcohol dehydrogenase family)